MRSRSDDGTEPLAARLAAFDFAGRSASRVVRCAISSNLYRDQQSSQFSWRSQSGHPTDNCATERWGESGSRSGPCQGRKHFLKNELQAKELAHNSAWSLG